MEGRAKVTKEVLCEEARFILANTEINSPPLVPEIKLRLAAESVPLWQKTEEELGRRGLEPPFWAFAWAGGQALARYVPLDIELAVCVLPHYLRGHVEAALLDVFSTRVLPDGTRGFFHPDNLTFGAGVALSALVAAAQAVPGVLSVKVTKLERLYEGPNDEIKDGIYWLDLQISGFESNAAPSRPVLYSLLSY